MPLASFFDDCLPTDLHNGAPFEADVKLQLESTGIDKDPSFNLSKPSGFFTYHQIEHSKILHGARFAFSVL